MRRRQLMLVVAALFCLFFYKLWDSQIQEPTEEEIKEAEAENLQRIRRIEEVCYKNNLGLYKHSDEAPKVKHPPAPQYGVFYVARKHNLTYCPVYKAGSTTWLTHLCILAGYTEEQLASSNRQLSDIAREAYPELDFEQAEQAFLSTVKLLVVRHPFARLLSAYRDKLENTRVGAEHGTAHFYKKYGQRIVQRYREGGNGTATGRLLRPDQYLLDASRPPPAGIEPTFNEFVRYLLDTDLSQRADDHWIPAYLLCTPCLLKYDLVAKVETLRRDQALAIRRAGLRGRLRPRWSHKGGGGGGSDLKAARAYFSQLNRKQVSALYDKYWLDFELFGYRPDEYLRYATAD